MDPPKRRQIRLPAFDYSSPGAYFVTVCTKERRCVLSNIAVGADALGGPTLTLTETGKTAEKYMLSMTRMPGIRLDQYVIMPNHIHMIVSIEAVDGPPGAAAPTAASLPEVIGAWKRLVHRECGRTVFQRSYYEHVIRNEKDWLEIRTYIDQNPARWAKDRYYEEQSSKYGG